MRLKFFLLEKEIVAALNVLPLPHFLHELLNLVNPVIFVGVGVADETVVLRGLCVADKIFNLGAVIFSVEVLAKIFPELVADELIKNSVRTIRPDRQRRIDVNHILLVHLVYRLLVLIHIQIDVARN